MAQGPAGHEAAVAAAADADAPLVDLGQSGQVGGEGLHVLPIEVAVVAHDGPGPLLPVAVGPPWVPADHHIAEAGRHLELVEEAVAVERHRAAVDVNQPRPSAVSTDAGVGGRCRGMDDEALDHLPIGRFDGYRLHRRQIQLGQHGVVE